MNTIAESPAEVEGKPLTDAEIVALPPVRFGDLAPLPPRNGAGICSKCGSGTRPHKKGARAPTKCKRCQTAPLKYAEDEELIGSCLEHWWNYSGAPSIVLDSKTSPEAIAAKQRQVIAGFLARKRDATAEQISEAVFLPVWVVERRVNELKGSRKRATA